MSVKELYENGTIKFLYNKGVVSIDVLCYFQYMDHYNTCRAMGEGYNMAINSTSDRFNVSQSTIKRAVRLLK